MYLDESSFINQMRVREQQLARELELRRRSRERMQEEGPLDNAAAPMPRPLHRWHPRRGLGHA